MVFFRNCLKYIKFLLLQKGLGLYLFEQVYTLIKMIFFHYKNVNIKVVNYVMLVNYKSCMFIYFYFYSEFDIFSHDALDIKPHQTIKS